MSIFRSKPHYRSLKKPECSAQERQVRSNSLGHQIKSLPAGCVFGWSSRVFKSFLLLWVVGDWSLSLTWAVSPSCHPFSAQVQGLPALHLCRQVRHNAFDWLVKVHCCLCSPSHFFSSLPLAVCSSQTVQ